jgi:acyl carrier protein
MKAASSPHDGSNGRFFCLLETQRDGSVEPIIDKVRSIISEQLKIPIERLTPETRLLDLGVESLDFVEIVFALEEEFDISIPYNANEAAAAGKGESAPAGLGKLETIGQISAAVKDLLATKTSV